MATDRRGLDHDHASSCSRSSTSCLAMTNGQWETQVLANYMYDKLFRAVRLGRRVGQRDDHHAAGDADPGLERHNARKEMR